MATMSIIPSDATVMMTVGDDDSAVKARFKIILIYYINFRSLLTNFELFLGYSPYCFASLSVKFDRGRKWLIVKTRTYCAL